MAAAPHTEAPERPTAAAQASASPLDSHASPVQDRGRRKGTAVAALVLGVVGIVTGIGIPIVGLVLGILATVLGATSRGEIRRGGYTNLRQASWGMYLGIAAIVVSVVAWIVTIAILTS